MSAERHSLGVRWVHVIGASLFAAALCSAAVRLPAPAYLLVLGAFVPWLAVLDRARTWRHALVHGAVLSVAFSVTVTQFFAEAAAAYTSAPRLVTTALLALLGPLVQPQMPLAALARTIAAPRGGGRVRRFAGFAAAWFAVEWAFPKLLGDTIGHALRPAALLRQAADVVGAGGLTVLVLAANELILSAALRLRAGDHATQRRVLAPAAALGVLLAGWAGYGGLRTAQLRARAAADALSVGIVQSAMTDYDRLARERGRYEVVREVLDVHEALSRELVRDGVDVVVWPETVYPTTFGRPRSETGADLDAEIVRFATEQRVPLVFGAYEGDGEREYNAAFFLSPSPGGVLRATYRKANLFPLTEWAPGMIGSEAVRAVLPWMGTWTPGPGPRVVDVPIRGRRLRAAPMLCYDAVRPAHAVAQARDGAELIVALSNDSWFTDGPGAALHLAVAAFRAIETRIPLVRAAPSGISALVDDTGEIVAATKVGDRSALAVTVTPRRSAPTVFVRVYPVLGLVALAVLAAAVTYPRRRPRQVGGHPG